jgi:hypothetical protein
MHQRFYDQLAAGVLGVLVYDFNGVGSSITVGFTVKTE